MDCRGELVKITIDSILCSSGPAGQQTGAETVLGSRGSPNRRPEANRYRPRVVKLEFRKRPLPVFIRRLLVRKGLHAFQPLTKSPCNRGDRSARNHSIILL